MTKSILFLLSFGLLIGACTNVPEEAKVSQAIEAASNSQSERVLNPLPERAGPRTRTTGSVPHTQIGEQPDQALVDEIFRRAFSLPGVENRPTIVSLPGGKGLWLKKDVSIAQPDAIVKGREFAHLHKDGSLHAPLPFQRALEVDEKGWGERHPWADDRKGWDGFVMLYSPRSMEGLETSFQLIVESYNHVTGQALQASDFE